MRKNILFVLLIIISLSITACANKHGDTINEAKEETNEYKGESEIQELIDLSEKLALQMEEGDFSETQDIMSFAMKLQMSEAALKQAWDTTRASIGAFVGLYDTTNEEVQEYNVIHVVLQYENNGMKVSFTYNKSRELDGLWLSYQPIEVEAVSNEEFQEFKI